MTAPRIAGLLALIGFLGLPVSAMMGVTPAADYMVDAAEVLLALGAILIIGHVVAGILSDARALKTTSK